jgi:hypothetical protein
LFANAKTVHATGALMMTVSTIQSYVGRQRTEVKNKTNSRQGGGVHEIVMALSPSRNAVGVGCREFNWI